MEGPMFVRSKRETLSPSVSLRLPGVSTGERAGARMQPKSCGGQCARGGVYQTASSGQRAGGTERSAWGSEVNTHESVWVLEHFSFIWNPRLDVGWEWRLVRCSPNKAGLLLGFTFRPCNTYSCLVLPGKQIQPISPAEWPDKSLYFGL